MSHCYLIAGLISFKPLTGAQGGTKSLYVGSMLGIFTYLIIIPPSEKLSLRINNLPKVIPKAQLGLKEPQVHLTHPLFPSTPKL